MARDLPRKTGETVSYDESRYLPLVRSISQEIWGSLGATPDLDQVIEYGMDGLREAIFRFQSRHGTTFQMFAQYCIRASIYRGLLRSGGATIRPPLAFRSLINELMQFHSGSAEGIVKRSIVAETNELKHIIQLMIPVWLLCKDAGGQLQAQSKMLLDSALVALEESERQLIQYCYYKKLPADGAAEKLRIPKPSFLRIHWKLLERIHVSLTSKFAEKSADKL